MWPFSKSQCECDRYPHLELDRKSISRRIRESPKVKRRLVLVADDSAEAIGLYRCPVCGQFWQSGREWNFGHDEYYFRVPALTAAEWREEHYRQPGAMMIYSAVMTQYVERSKFTPSANRCRKEGCEAFSSVNGVFCRRHQIEALQEIGQLPKPPVGRLFPPYHDKIEA